METLGADVESVEQQDEVDGVEGTATMHREFFIQRIEAVVEIQVVYRLTFDGFADQRRHGELRAWQPPWWIWEALDGRTRHASSLRRFHTLTRIRPTRKVVGAVSKQFDRLLDRDIEQHVRGQRDEYSEY